MSLLVSAVGVPPPFAWLLRPWPRQWLVVAAAAVGMLASFVVNTSIAVFLKPFEAEFGWLRADIAIAYTLMSAGAALGGLIVGWLFDRIDVRPIVVFGMTVCGCGLIVLSFSTDLFMIQCIYLAIGIFGFACLYTPLIAIVGVWFERRRGLAMGIVTAGGTLGQGISPLAVQPMIEAFGWRHAYLVLGIVYLIVLVPLMLLFTKPLATEGPAKSAAADAAASPGPSPWVSVPWLGVAALFCCVSMAIPVIHLVPLLADKGLPTAAAGGLMLTTMLSASVGRVCFGMFCDRIGPLRSYALAVFVQTITVHWFVELPSLPALYALAVVFGFGYGGVMTTLTLSVRAAVPVRYAGISMAVVGLLAWLGMGLGGYQGGYCFDLTGNYRLSFASAALAGVANLLVIAGFAAHLRWNGRLTRLVHDLRRATADALRRGGVRPAPLR
ncbi:MAG: MFS transporter [Alphaproteobacteria bacterium]|nr:MFS transporter [Alphaproteobacteria bacterium]